MSEVFTEVILSTGQTAVVIEGSGDNLFNAMNRSKGNNGDLMKYLVIELVKINGQSIDSAQAEALHIKDVQYLIEVINIMMTK